MKTGQERLTRRNEAAGFSVRTETGGGGSEHTHPFTLDPGKNKIKDLRGKLTLGVETHGAVRYCWRSSNIQYEKPNYVEMHFEFNLSTGGDFAVSSVQTQRCLQYFLLHYAVVGNAGVFYSKVDIIYLNMMKYLVLA